VKKTNSLWAALQSGSNMLYHAVGWLEGGLIARPEIFLMECERLQYSNAIWIRIWWQRMRERLP